MYFYLYFALYEDDEVWERFQELNLINQFIKLLSNKPLSNVFRPRLIRICPKFALCYAT